MSGETAEKSKLRLELSNSEADQRTISREYREAMDAANASPELSSDPTAAKMRQRLDKELKAATKRVEDAQLKLTAHEKIEERKQRKAKERVRTAEKLAQKEPGKSALGFKRRGKSFDRER